MIPSILIPQNYVFEEQKKSKKSTNNHQKKFKGLHPAPPPYGAAAAPPPPTKVGANCLSAVVLDDQNRDHALSLE